MTMIKANKKVHNIFKDRSNLIYVNYCLIDELPFKIDRIDDKKLYLYVVGRPTALKNQRIVALFPQTKFRIKS
jgi:hypothetical protein